MGVAASGVEPLKIQTETLPISAPMRDAPPIRLPAMRATMSATRSPCAPASGRRELSCRAGSRHARAPEPHDKPGRDGRGYEDLGVGCASQ